jgi:putative acetyltransferase
MRSPGTALDIPKSKGRGPRNSKIRLVERRDDEAALDVVRVVRAEFGVVGEGFNWLELDKMRLSGTYGVSGSAYFIVEIDNLVSGGAGIAGLLNHPSVCELQRMYLAAHARRRGLGRALLERCLYTARRFGYQKCYLESSARLLRANHMYERAGFRRLAAPLRQSEYPACNVYFLLDL